MAIGELAEREASNIDSLVLRLVRALWRRWNAGTPEQYWSDAWVQTMASASATDIEDALASAGRTGFAFGRQMVKQVSAPFPTGATPRVNYPRAGAVAIDEVYSRPAAQFRYAFSQAADREVAERERLGKRAALLRLEKLVDADVQRAVDQGEQLAYEASQLESDRLWAEAEAAESDGIESPARARSRTADVERKTILGFRRVLHPELSRSGPCGLCIVASTGFYTIGELKRLHLLCKCTTAPLTDTFDPGLQLNKADLKALYEAAGGTQGRTLRDLHLRDVTHGELGPLLTINDDRTSQAVWRDPSDALDAQRWSEEAARVDALTESIRAALRDPDRQEVTYVGAGELNQLEKRARRLEKQMDAYAQRRSDARAAERRAEREARNTPAQAAARRARRAKKARERRAAERATREAKTAEEALNAA
ncbi:MULTISPECIES: hypothetical protein [unclassified Pseudoclavibacter]|uniref:hypothetical protein n=1 Tax=unclassified Pseudoclavibacter TaxID=2615177 RepID=UPI001BA5512E|nr:hypothetical protein [Pseudoclavibacter sp. Marseille-Q4354]MBS3177745.1 hypothetical protein [Pseudoclavibacter sp. Marseille-Q4354]